MADCGSVTSLVAAAVVDLHVGVHAGDEPRSGLANEARAWTLRLASRPWN
jgi:hypothetical protein